MTADIDTQIVIAQMQRNPALAKQLRHDAMRAEIAALGSDDDALHLVPMDQVKFWATVSAAACFAFVMLFAAGCFQ